MGVGLADVRDIIAGTLRDVETIGTSPVLMRGLLDDLRGAERILGKRLRDQMVKHGSLDSRFTGAHALAMQTQVQQTIDYVQDRLRGRTTEQAKAGINAAIGRTITTLEGLEQRFTGIATPLRLRQAAVFQHVQGTATGMWARQFPTSVDRYGAKMLGEFEEIIRAGLIAGSSMDDMIAALTGHGGPTGKVSMSAKVTPAGVLRVVENDIPEGLFVRHKYWAERIVRTEVLKAYNGARQAALEDTHDHQFPGMKRKILAVLDKRTAKDSIAVHGQIRGIKEHFVDGAGRSYLYPPARPNDRETVIPWRTEWEDSSENLSDWEKVCIGEGDAETEAKLEATMKAIAAGQTGPATPRAKKTAAATTPMQKPKKPTYGEKVEADLRGKLGYSKFVGATFQGEQIGYVHASKDIDGKDQYRPRTIMRGVSKDVLNYGPGFATEDEARDALMQHLHTHMAGAAKTIQKYDEKGYKAAVAAKDTTTMRRMTRGLLYDNGVMPRDSIFSDLADKMDILPNSRMPDARAWHEWTGATAMRRDVFDEASYKSSGPRDEFSLKFEREKFHSHLRTMIHEELHGSTNFLTSNFYMGFGATVEEVTVEMAARKIASKATGVAVDWYRGSYQPQIEAVTKVVQEEVAKVKGAHRGVKDREAIADAGIGMRGRNTTTRPTASTHGILDQFIDNLKVPAKAKQRIRARIEAEVKAPR